MTAPEAAPRARGRAGGMGRWRRHGDGNGRHARGLGPARDEAAPAGPRPGCVRGRQGGCRAPRQDQPAAAASAANKPAEPPVTAPQQQAEAVPPAAPQTSTGEVTRGEAARQLEESKYWALQGVRSLSINLDETGERVCFESLGAEPRLQATLVSESSLRYLGWALALVVGLIGLALTDRPVRTKAIYVIESLVLALILPLLVGWILQLEITEMFEPAFYTACLLIPYYLFAGCVTWLARKLAGLRWRRPAAVAATLLVTLLTSVASAQDAAAPDWNKILEMLNPGPPIQLPNDAVVIPYDPADPAGTTSAAKVLVPYAKYVELWNAAYPDQQLEARRPPASYALAGATYQATLADEQDLLITGKIVIDSFVDDAVTVPLGIVGGVLTQATLDGQPARLHILQPTAPPPPPSPEQQAAAQQVTSPVAPAGTKFPRRTAALRKRPQATGAECADATGAQRWMADRTRPPAGGSEYAAGSDRAAGTDGSSPVGSA